MTLPEPKGREPVIPVGMEVATVTGKRVYVVVNPPEEVADDERS